MAVILFDFAQICNKKLSLIISWFNNIGCHVLLVISRGRDSYMNLFVFYSVTGVSVYCFFGLTNILSFLICQSFAPINSLSCPCFMELSVYNYEKGYIYEYWRHEFIVYFCFLWWDDVRLANQKTLSTPALFQRLNPPPLKKYIEKG